MLNDGDQIAGYVNDLHKDPPTPTPKKVTTSCWIERSKRRAVCKWEDGFGFNGQWKYMYCLYQQMDTLPGIGIYVPACLWVCVCACVCYWKQPVNIVAVENGKGRELFATCCSKRTVLTVEKHWEIKDFFHVLSFIAYYIFLRCHSHRCPIRSTEFIQTTL